MLIYKITNNINGKIYIGQTTRTLKKRIADHKRTKKCTMYKAFKKYGFENFTIEVIFETDNVDKLNEKEVYFIKKYNSLMPNGYNLCKGGRNTEGYNHTEHSKLKMSISKAGTMQGEENPFYGKSHSEETRRKMKDKFKDEEFFNKRREHLNKVRFIRTRKIKNVTTGEVFNSIKEACEKYKIKDGTHISRVCRGKRKSCFGFVFEYID